MRRKLTTHLLVVAQAVAMIGCAKDPRTDGVAAKGAQLGQWTMDIDAAASLAKEKDLPLLYNFTGSDWCAYCEVMREQVFARPEWQEYAGRKLVLVTVDRPQDVGLVPKRYRERNAELHKHYRVEDVPTYLLLDSDNATLLDRFGIPPHGPDVFAFIRQVIAATRARPSEVAAFTRNMSLEAAAEYKELLAKKEEVRRKINAWVATNPEKSPENDAVFSQFQTRLADAEKLVQDAEIAKALDELDDGAANSRKMLDDVQEYTALLDELRAARGELLEWLLRRPENTPKSRQTIESMKARITTLTAKINAVGADGESQPHPRAGEGQP